MADKLYASLITAASKDKPIPTGESATKTSNHIVKHYKAKRHKNSLGSNPYSDHQSHSHSISKSQHDKLKKDLHAQGWKHEHTHTYHKDRIEENTGHKFTHSDGGHVELRSHKGHDGSESHSVSTHGRKKAKRSNLPYYD